MKRRRSLNPWPAMTDLMTALAAVALFIAYQYSPEEVRKLRKRVADLTGEVERLEKELAQTEQRYRELLGQEEEAKNRLMFKAIQGAEDVGAELRAAVPDGTWGTDQSLRFGQDLLTFETDRFEVRWAGDSRARMRRFCEALEVELAKEFCNGHPRREAFVLFVEGHTDAQRCEERDDCNWFISANRAAALRVEMMKEEVCPGGSSWTVQPVGLASARPLVEEHTDADRAMNRRIELKIAPNYSRIVQMKDCFGIAEDQ